MGNLNRLSLVVLNLAQRITAVFFNARGIDHTDVKPRFVKHVGEELIIVSLMFHDHAGLAFNGPFVALQAEPSFSTGGKASPPHRRVARCPLRFFDWKHQYQLRSYSTLLCHEICNGQSYLYSLPIPLVC